MSLQVDVAQNPFPWSVALLASHQNIQIDWLAGKLKGKEVSQRAWKLPSNQLISLRLGCVLR